MTASGWLLPGRGFEMTELQAEEMLEMLRVMAAELTAIREALAEQTKPLFVTVVEG